MYRTILLVCGLASLVSSFPAAFDNVNADALAKPEVVDAYIGCLLETGDCNESGLRLKAITPNALQEKCSQCTPFQRENVQKVSKAIATKKPAEWEKIVEKYDPKGLHRSDIDSLVNGRAEEKPAEPAKPEDAPKPAEPAKLEEPSKPADPAKAENSAKSAAKPEEPAKLAEPLKAEPAKLEEPSKPAEQAKPAADLEKKPDAPSS